MLGDEKIEELMAGKELPMDYHQLIEFARAVEQAINEAEMLAAIKRSPQTN